MTELVLRSVLTWIATACLSGVAAVVLVQGALPIPEPAPQSIALRPPVRPAIPTEATATVSSSANAHGDHYGEDFWTYVQRVRPEVSRPETAVVSYLSVEGLAPTLAGCLNLWGFDSARSIGNGGLAWNTVGIDEAQRFDHALFACRVQHPYSDSLG